MPTATDPTDPGHVLEDLRRLKDGVSAALYRETELERERTAHMVNVRRDLTRRGETEAVAISARLSQLNAAYQVAVEHENAAHEARRAQVHNAYHSSRSSLARRVQQAKDRRIGRVQGSIMRDRQTRREELARMNDEHLAFQQLLIADRSARYAIRGDTLASFRSFRLLFTAMFDNMSRKAILADVALPPQELRNDAVAQLKEARERADAARRLVPAMLFRYLPLSALVLAVLAVFAYLAFRSGGPGLAAVMPGLLITEGALAALWLAALVISFAPARRISAHLARARSLGIAADMASSCRVVAFAGDIQKEEAEQGRDLSETFRESDSEWQAAMREGQQKLELQIARLPGKLDNLHQRKLKRIAQRHELAVERVRAEGRDLDDLREALREKASEAADAKVSAAIGEMANDWRDETARIDRSLRALDAESLARFPAWTPENCAAWTPPTQAPAAVRVGTIRVDVAAMAGGLPGDPRLALAGEGAFQVPFALGFPDHGSVLIESDGDPGGAATAVLYGMVLRLLASSPPGRSTFTFIDPVGLGKGFAGLMHLADYEETLIHNRIWTQTTQIEERLAELNEHIEKVIQMYLRNEFATIAEYNEQADCIAEKYRFLVIAGFPSAFSETAGKRLLSIASSGARCGVHLLIHRDTRLSPPEAAIDDELRRACLTLRLERGAFHITGAPAGADVVTFETPPPVDDATTLIHRIGRASIDSNRVEVPFSHIAPPEGEDWSSETTEELRVPVGRTGAKKLQMLAIGKGTRQHALVAGKTGSGKSTLFHVIITNLALWCAPDQVEFYLVDFKKGVEFKCYASKKLPHAKVVAIESDREFALSVLQRVDGELKRRGELFRRAGAQDLAGYKRAAGPGPMPRCLLLIDEFQEFFTEDDAVAQESSLLLDRIVRQGRAFGIHVILGSQTLGGAYTLARATLGQMVIRIALQCNETDAHLIMDDDNPAPRLLTRPGEGIYNDQAGTLAANSPFQVVWISEDERDARLDHVAAMAASRGYADRAPIVFEGNAPADVRDNSELAAELATRPAARPSSAHAWLGAPNSIKGPTEALFQRQSGSHLLLVGQSAERATSLLGIAMLSLAAQYAPGDAEFVVLDPQPPDLFAASLFHRLAHMLPHRIRVATPADTPAIMAELAAQLEARGPDAGRSAPEVYLIIHDLQRFKSLRQEDDFRFSTDDDTSSAVSASQALASLLGEGGPAGIHVIAGVDTWNNVSRWIPRKLLGEFEMRVLFQMSANDSANLIDSPAASMLGLHRALFHNEHFGSLETFRPYAMPDESWLAEMEAKITGGA